MERGHSMKCLRDAAEVIGVMSSDRSEDFLKKENFPSVFSELIKRLRQRRNWSDYFMLMIFSGVPKEITFS
jgi:hypothetical protein